MFIWNVFFNSMISIKYKYSFDFNKIDIDFRYAIFKRPDEYDSLYVQLYTIKYLRRYHRKHCKYLTATIINNDHLSITYAIKTNQHIINFEGPLSKSYEYVNKNYNTICSQSNNIWVTYRGYPEKNMNDTLEKHTKETKGHIIDHVDNIFCTYKLPAGKKS